METAIETTGRVEIGIVVKRLMAIGTLEVSIVLTGIMANGTVEIGNVASEWPFVKNLTIVGTVFIRWAIDSNLT